MSYFQVGKTNLELQDSRLYNVDVPTLTLTSLLQLAMVVVS